MHLLIEVRDFMLVMDKQPSTMIASGIRTTPFGAREDPTLLTRKKYKTVCRVDTLACLKEIWGENILSARQHLYELVSGTVSDEDFQALITSYYKRYSAFANYVDEKYLFESKDIPLLARIIQPARERIRTYEFHLLDMCKGYRVHYIGNHQDYAFFEVRGDHIPPFEESKIIC